MTTTNNLEAAHNKLELENLRIELGINENNTIEISGKTYKVGLGTSTGVSQRAGAVNITTYSWVISEDIAGELEAVRLGNLTDRTEFLNSVKADFASLVITEPVAPPLTAADVPVPEPEIISEVTPVVEEVLKPEATPVPAKKGGRKR